MHPRPVGSTLPGFIRPSGSNSSFSRRMHSSVSGVNSLRHHLVLLHPHAVLAGDGAARRDAVRQDLLARRAGLFQVAGLARDRKE